MHASCCECECRCSLYERGRERGVTVSVSLHCLGESDRNSFEVVATRYLLKERQKKKKAENPKHELVSIYVYVYPLLFCIGSNEYSNCGSLFLCLFIQEKWEGVAESHSHGNWDYRDQVFLEARDSLSYLFLGTWWKLQFKTKLG